eukprot:TRINITY_DN13107_c0_g1_i3.p1 TRINITY_DN13107_c0_g1~~TRINITY_DN13107_c0_g1_i3.p1  ORF type:complete len:367 (+),score=44.92 TRINITY_DN13107_c0_g1_i3:122-1102(+)
MCGAPHYPPPAGSTAAGSPAVLPHAPDPCQPDGETCPPTAQLRAVPFRGPSRSPESRNPLVPASRLGCSPSGDERDCADSDGATPPGTPPDDATASAGSPSAPLRLGTPHELFSPVPAPLQGAVSSPPPGARQSAGRIAPAERSRRSLRASSTAGSGASSGSHKVRGKGEKLCTHRLPQDRASDFNTPPPSRCASEASGLDAQVRSSRGRAPKGVPPATSSPGAASPDPYRPPQIIVRDPVEKTVIHCTADDNEATPLRELTARLAQAYGGGALKILDKSQLAVLYDPAAPVARYPGSTFTYLWTIGASPPPAPAPRGRRCCCSIQ